MIRGNRPNLTAQERALVVYLAQGLRAKQIAAALHISDRVCVRRFQALRKKLGVLTYFQAGVLCERYQLIPVRQANIIEDRREERLDALRSAP